MTDRWTWLRSHLQRREVWGPVAVTACLIALEILVILFRNDGVFTYTLDDPYIHFALAENLLHGHYGVNLGEVSSPSSSILWPVLMAPLLPLAGSLAAMVVNVPAALATAGLLGHVAGEVVGATGSQGDGRSGTSGTEAAITATILVVILNVVGLVFTGMEHSLQVLLSLGAVYGLYRVLVKTDGPVPGWLWGVLILGPLIRFENLALTVPAILVLGVERSWRPAAWAGGALAVGLGGFALFLKALGLPALPSSVLVKTDLAAGQSPSVVRNVIEGLRHTHGAFLAMAGIACTAVVLSAQRSRAERVWGAWIVAVLTLHLAFGKFGWFYRYEMYVLTAAFVGTGLLYHSALRRLLEAHRLWTTVPVLVLVGIFFARISGQALINTPRASGEIYGQQYQMHRFVTEFYHRPVAVNDLGWVAYRNDRYVFDVVGLAHYPSYQVRQQAPDGTPWMGQAVAPYADSVRLAMIYPLDHVLPDSWTKVAELRLHRPTVSAHRPSVAFYAFDQAEARQIRPDLRRFRATLPDGVSLDIAPVAKRRERR